MVLSQAQSTMSDQQQEPQEEQGYHLQKRLAVACTAVPCLSCYERNLTIVRAADTTTATNVPQKSLMRCPIDAYIITLGLII